MIFIKKNKIVMSDIILVDYYYLTLFDIPKAALNVYK